ncbi:MAG TPA: FecR family protein [Candidatus Acidoferrum sp.]|nr:FecR family protein [Candidatus Acidoferrum sp.]
MASRISLRFVIFLAVVALTLSASCAFADTSHARIIRLSYVQGDVRITHNVSGDPLQSSDTAWESASLNLPIHQGDAIATDNGRAEVEFESGSVAFVSENTVLEFYDLSLEDGAFTTRLIVRQGSASFYVRPSRGDYFSVTGGDFSIEATDKAEFRLNNYDDGSDVQVMQGRVSVLGKSKTTVVSKGQALSMRAGDEASSSVDHAASQDDFDQWVSGRISSGQAALSSSQQYTGVYDYTSGFGDLYTFGGWYNVGGFGYCWRPYGVSFGWNPFQFGNWIFDPFFGGWTFIGGQPWGWLPYHYGGWIFQPGLGWVWSPAGGFPRSGSPFPHSRGNPWRPVTATFVHSGSQVGLVPVHPLDEHGKTPMNLREGVFPVSQRGVSDRIQVSESDKWKNFKNSSREGLPTTVERASAPARVVRSMSAGGSNAGVAIAAKSGGAGIKFDPVERRFVNEANSVSSERAGAGTKGVPTVGQRQMPPTAVAGSKGSDLRRGTELPGARGAGVTTARGAVPPSSRGPAMPPPPRTSAGTSGASNGSRWGGSSASASSGSSSRTWSGGSSGSSSAASAPRSSGSSSSGSSSSGGRPH